MARLVSAACFCFGVFVPRAAADEQLAASLKCSFAKPNGARISVRCLAAHSSEASGDEAAAREGGCKATPPLWVSTTEGAPLRAFVPVFGCEGAVPVAAPGGSAGAVCIVRRGGCAFGDKARAATAAGCAALLVVDRQLQGGGDITAGTATAANGAAATAANAAQAEAEAAALSPPGLGEYAPPIPVAMLTHSDGTVALAAAANAAGAAAADAAAEQWRASVAVAEQAAVAPDAVDNKPQDLVRYRRAASIGTAVLERHCAARYHSAVRAGGPVRVVEGLMFNNEVDMLELHLQELYAVVDVFVVVEAKQSHQGKAKPLYFEQAKTTVFAPYLDKIEHVVIDRFPFECVQRCNCENHQRNAMMEGVARLDPPLADDDLLLVSDVDEILRADVVRGLKQCAVPMPAYLHLDFFYYSFHYQNRWTSDRGGVFTGAQAAAGMVPQHVRLLNQTFRSEIEDAGWHCSYFGGVDMIVNKLHSNCQTEYAGPPWDNATRIAAVLKTGTDLFDRKSEALLHVKGCAHAPLVVAGAPDHKYCRYVY